MTDIARLPNLGPKSQQMLADARITTLDGVRRLGAVRAYAAVKATGANASLNLLWVLEGAVTGLDWRVVACEHRLSLLLALETHLAAASQATGRHKGLSLVPACKVRQSAAKTLPPPVD